MSDPRDFLRALVLRAGTRALEAAEEDLEVERKGRVDLVTRVDREIQDLLTRELRRWDPRAEVVAEESAAPAAAPPGRVWYVDPLDGTTNYVHGHPFWAVSVGGWQDGVPRLGAVYAPVLDELFLASHGVGATWERPERGVSARPLQVSSCERLEEALLATGFPYRRDETCRLNLRCAGEALARARGLRRGGSAALDLCHVAAGRLDGFWEPTLRPWDVAAGGLIAAEAGAVVSDYRGRPDYLWARRVVAANPRLHPELLEMLASAHARPEDWPLGRPFPGPVPLHRRDEEEPL